MKKIVLGFYVVAVLIGSSYAQDKNSNGKNNKTQEQTKGKFRCPMDKAILSDKPGKCSKCGMTLKDTSKKIKQ